jgi:tetratricopeptide (TPR) repeat protein
MLFTGKAVSEEDRKKADEFKAQGNKLVAEKNFEEAIAKYTKAIELNPNSAVYYSNRYEDEEIASITGFLELKYLTISSLSLPGQLPIVNKASTTKPLKMLPRPLRSIQHSAKPILA